MKAILPSESLPSVVKEPCLLLMINGVWGKRGKHRSGDGGPYTWAGGEELKVRPNVTRRLALTLQRATKHVLLTQMSVQPTELKTYSVPRDSTKELCPSMRAMKETASKPLKLASSGVRA